jgi:transposase
MSKRRQLTAEQKVAIVRAHLLEGVPVSDLCDKHKIHATQFYAWQKQLFENGASAFARKSNGANVRRQQTAQEQRIEQLETKLQNRNEVVAELLEEHVKLKKAPLQQDSWVRFFSGSRPSE